jgi:hypothetical protein
MRYLRVQWLHFHPDEPAEIFSEITEDGWEVRKVEIFPDGSVGFASPNETMGSTMLSVEPLPALEEIRSDSQFKPVEISREEFENMWQKRFQPTIAKPA